MNIKTDEVVYYTVHAPGGILLANFRNKGSAESYATTERERRVAELMENRAEMTQSEYRGAMNYATYGITVRNASLVFEDALTPQAAFSFQD